MKIFFIFCLMATQALTAQIETVTLNWNPVSCYGNCADLLRQQFEKIPGVVKISVSKEAGVAVLTYEPGAAFSYQPINVAMRLVGPALNRLSIKVKGEIRPGEKSVSLISTGDNTKFELLGPMNVTGPNTAVVVDSPDSYPLTKDLESQLLNAYKEKKLAVIEGMILEPNRAPPNYLIIEKMSFVDPEKKGKKR